MLIMNIQLLDISINCEIAGDTDKPELIFLHGNGENLHIFDSQIAYFSQFFRTIALDTRGHGKSTRGEKPLNFHTFANDLLEVFDALKIDKAHIVGFSDGAITALHFALLFPERISSMILLGTNFNPKGLIFIVRYQTLFFYTCLSFLSLFSKKIRKRKEIWNLMVNHPDLTLEELSLITVPTLIVTGEKDVVSQSHNDEICKAISGSKRLIIPKGNHFWMFKQKDVFNKCIMDFIVNYI